MKDESKTTIILWMMIFLLIGIIGGYFIKDIKFKKEKENTEIVNNKVLKTDNKKDYINDADYGYNVSKSYYTTKFGNTYYVKDIVVPYINVKSNDSDIVNADIKKVFDEAIKIYNKGVQDKMHYVELSNKKYVDDKILSIAISYGVGATDIVYPTFYTYNLSSETGQFIKYEEVYQLLSFTSNNINEKVEVAIGEALKQIFSDFNEDTSLYNKHLDESINNYKKSVIDNTLNFYVNSNKKLNVIVDLSIPAGKGTFATAVERDEKPKE